MKKVWKKIFLNPILCVALLFQTVGTSAAVLAEEANTNTLGTVYEPKTDVQSFRGDNLSAPKKEGYVFAGWYKEDAKAEGGYSPMSAAEADNATDAIAKFVDSKVLGFGFQLNAGTTIYSERTDIRLLTSVDSLRYKSVGFEVKVGGKTTPFTSKTVYRTINGYEYKDAYNYKVSYTPQETFSTESEYFMAFKLKNVPSTAYGVEIQVTPIWTTLDGTLVVGIAETFTIESVLCELGENLQASYGTNFEGFATHEVTNTWVENYYHNINETGRVWIISDGVNSYTKLLPTADAGTATITKACSTDILKAGTYQISMDVKLGSAFDGELLFGLWDGVAWSPAWPLVEIDTSSANAEGWTTVTYEYTLSENKTGTFANLDIAYYCAAASEDNYILIDNIQVISTLTDSNADTKGYGDFEGIITSLEGLLSTEGWKQDGTNSNVIYVSSASLENELVIDENVNKSFKFYTATGRSASADFAGNPTFATAGLYKLSAKVKLGPGATKVDNIGFRFFAQNSLGTGDIVFEGLESLSSDRWVTLEAYFKVPATVTTSYINMNVWVFTHNDEINSIDNYVLMDDIEVRTATLPPCNHEYTYEFITTPTYQAEGEAKAICRYSLCSEETTVKVMMTPQVTRTGLDLSWTAVDNAKGYKLYDNNQVVADLGNVLTYHIAPNSTHSYTVEAYTDAEGYRNYSEKSNAITVTLGENLQAPKGTGFNGFASLEVKANWDDIKNYYHNINETGKVWVVNDGTNSYAQCLPIDDGGTATITKSCSKDILKAGTYKISMDVKLGSTFDGKLLFGIFDGVAWAPSWPLVEIDTSSANSETWTTVAYEFTLSESMTGEFANMDLAYYCSTADTDNYILIDNIQIIDTATNSNVDTNGSGDFEGIVSCPTGLLTTGGWKQDNTGNDVIFVSDMFPENDLVVDNSGDRCFKFYTSAGASTSVNFAGNPAIATAGLYKISMKVKLGSAATNVDNIGFRFYAASDPGTGDMTFSGLDQLSSDKWVTLETYFTVPTTVSTNYINMNFWVFTHNDVIGSVDNYVLVDDIEVRAVY